MKLGVEMRETEIDRETCNGRTVHRPAPPWHQAMIALAGIAAVPPRSART